MQKLNAKSALLLVMTIVFAASGVFVGFMAWISYLGSEVEGDMATVSTLAIFAIAFVAVGALLGVMFALSRRRSQQSSL